MAPGQSISPQSPLPCIVLSSLSSARLGSSHPRSERRNASNSQKSRLPEECSLTSHRNTPQTPPKPLAYNRFYYIYSIYICIYYIYQYIYKYIPAVKKINEASKKGRRMRPDDPGSPHHRCLPFGRPRRVGARAREGRGCVHTSGVRRSRSFCRGWKCVQGMDETQSKSVLKIDGVQDG